MHEFHLRMWDNFLSSAYPLLQGRGEGSSLQFAALSLLFSRFGVPHMKPCCRSGPPGWRWAGRTFLGECPWSLCQCHSHSGLGRPCGVGLRWARGPGVRPGQPAVIQVGSPAPCVASGETSLFSGRQAHPAGGGHISVLEGASGQHPRAATAALVCGT